MTEPTTAQGTQGQAGQGQPGTSAPITSDAASTGWSPDIFEREYKAKPAEDIAKQHWELSRRIGQQGNELGQLRKTLEAWGQWRPIIESWSPIMQQVGYDPQRLAAYLERAADRAGAQGDRQGERQLDAQAQTVRSWADALTPHDQESWLRDYVSGQVTPLQSQWQEQMQVLANNMAGYINRFGDLALRAIERKFDALPENVRPKITLNDLLQEAVNIASNRYDPLDWAYRLKTAESPEALQARIEQEVRAKIQEEQRNQQLTTSVGAGGLPRSPRPMRPLSASSAGPPKAPARTNNMAEARQKFLDNFPKMVAQLETP